MPQLVLSGFCKRVNGTAQAQGEPPSRQEQKLSKSGDLSGYGKPNASTEFETQLDAENDQAAGNQQHGQTSSKNNKNTADVGKEEPGLCQYEQARRQRMQENFEKLRSLGLCGGVADVVAVPDPAKKRPSKRKSPNSPQKSVPVRRSTRAKHSSELVHGASKEESTAPLGESSPPELEAKCVPAPWMGPEVELQLPGSKATSEHDGDWSKSLCAEDDLDGFHAFHCSLISSQLKGVYSLSWYGRLLLGAGKGGICSLFSVPEVAQEEELECLASCQLHRSWISDAEMIHPLRSDSFTSSNATACTGGAAMPWVLSASNGGEIALWDVSHVDGSGTFSQIAGPQHVHSKGIYSMHVCPGSAAVRPTGIEVVRSWEDVHAGTAKAVRWRDSQLAASSGNDRVVRLLDPRSAGPTVSINDAHNTAINTLSWASSVASGSSAPCSATVCAEHLLLSTSFDPSIKIHDIRRLDTPFATLCGHTQLPKCKKIHQASFCWGGRGVLCGGEENTRLYLYDIHAAMPPEAPGDMWASSEGVRMLGATELGHCVSTTQVHSSGRFIAATGGRGDITVLRAVSK